MKQVVALLLVAVFLLGGCARLPEVFEKNYQVYEGPATEEYIRGVVRDAVAQFEEPGMSEYEKVKAAFDYLIEIGYYRLPVGLDVFRLRSTDDYVPTFVETRSLSLLLYGIGVCEDYSAAMMMMLDEMGIESRYIPGLTYSKDGYLVHHAWMMAKVDGVWYHIDCELEDGISDGTVVYKYFMKSDATMRASHFWGENLIHTGLLQQDQNEEIARLYLGEYCPQDYPTPAPKEIPVTEKPDEDGIRAELAAELKAYQRTYGPLAYKELEIMPPVFGRYGGYNASRTPPEDPTLRIYNSTAAKLIIQPDA